MSQENSRKCNAFGRGCGGTVNREHTCSTCGAIHNFDAVAFVMAYESGELRPSEILVGMAELTKSGDIWNLQGSYGRAAQGFIDGELFDDQGTLSDLGQEIADGLYDGVNVDDDYS